MSALESLKNKISGTDKSVKAGLGYTVGNLLVRGISFLTLPIFSRLMTTEEFGIYNVFLSYEAILYVIIGLALHSSIKSANYEFKGKIDEYTSSVSIIYWIGLVVFLGLAAIFGKSISGIMGVPYEVMFMLVCYSFGSAVVTLYNERISLDYSYFRYMVVALINSVGNVAVSLILILTIFRESRDTGRILGTSAVLFGLGVAIMISFYAKSRPGFNGKYWSFGIKFSAPIIPHGISQVLLGQCDRVMIKAIVNASAAGIYSLAGNINLILTVISASIDTAWSTWFFAEMNEGRIENIKKRAVNMCVLFTILAVGLMALSPELVFILGGHEYDAAKFVAVPLIMDAFVLFLYNIVVASEYYMKKTQYIMMGTIIAAVINVILNYIFIMKYGYIAAAYTTLFSYLCYLALHVAISRKFMKCFVLHPKWIVSSFALAAVCGAFDLIFVNSIIARYALCAVVVIILGMALIKRIKKVS